MNGPRPPGAIADDLRALVVGTLEDLVAHHLPGWRIPGTFAGHHVEPDVAADLVTTLGHLAGAGVERVADTPVIDAIATVLRGIDGPATHTFFSYRVAETLRPFGRFADNALLAGWSEAERANVAAACDTTEWIPLLDEGILPRNYAAVLARCELARLELGLLDDDAVVDDLVGRLATLLGTNPRRHLDDSNGSVGRYDIYTADVWLFTEPLAPRLGPLWEEGLATALDLVATLATPDGTAVAWGRSTGLLGAALTVELAALALDGRSDDPRTWVALAAAATDRLPGWFDDGVTTAYRHRSPYGYRGTFRRLQLTLDVLGKLAWAAGRLATLDPDVEVDGDGDAPSARSGDTLVRLEDDRPAAVWRIRRPALDAVVPFVGATRSDYLAATRCPGLFEVPVDSDIPCWTPLVVHKGKRFTLGGVPDTLVEHDGGVEAAWEGLVPVGDLDPPADGRRLAGRGRLGWRVRGRTIELDVALELDVPAQAVTVVVPEVDGRPLDVRVVTSEPAVTVDTVDVAGVAEWRSFWGPLPLVHQLDVTAADRLALTVAVTPKLRVSSSAHGHHYDERLYAPLADRVVELRPAVGAFASRGVALDEVDLFHLHWPEWVVLEDPDEHVRVIRLLTDAGIPIVWTAHNLTPHDKRHDVHDPAYRAWAAAADAVINHSAWGRDRFLERWPEAAGADHVVIPHGHFGELYGPLVTRSRAEIEADLGLAACGLRIGVVGAPRREKDVQAVLDAVAACSRDDVQLVCWSLEDEDVPDDPRIAIAEPYEMVDATVYAERLAVCDVLALPFDPDGEMLATGTVADVIGMGLAALVSDWGYLAEALGDAGIPAGRTATEWVRTIDALTPEAVERAQAAAVARQAETAWDRIADATMEVFESVIGRGGRRARSGSPVDPGR